MTTDHSQSVAKPSDIPSDKPSDQPSGRSMEELRYPIYLDKEAIQKFIPHRDAMLFAQNVTVLDHNHYQGDSTWLADSFVFQGHFPGTPIVPGVIIVEAGAQIAGVGLLAGDPKSRASVSNNIGLLAGIRKCFFRRPVPPGLKLTFDIHIRHIADDVVNVSSEVSCEFGSVASLEFVFAQKPLDTLVQHLGQVNAT